MSTFTWSVHHTRGCFVFAAAFSVIRLDLKCVFADDTGAGASWRATLRFEDCASRLNGVGTLMAISYLRLDPNQIIDTVEVLTRRIRERFPQSNLNKVCDSLLDVARQAQVRSDQIARPMYALRLLTVLFIAGVVSLFVVILRVVGLEDNHIGLEDLLSMGDAGFQTLVVVGATVVFLTTLSSVRRKLYYGLYQHHCHRT